MDLPFNPSVFRSYLSLKAILQGLGGAAVIYLLIILFVAITGPAKLRSMEDTLASQKISLSSKTAHKQASPTHDKHATTAHDTHHDPSHDKDHKEETHHDPQQEQNKDALLPAPFEGLSEPTKDGHGVLPKKSARGLTPFHAYKRPFIKTKKPVIALAIRDFGLSKSQSDTLLEQLPRDVTLIVSPYAPHIDQWSKDMRSAGYETWLYIPAQDHTYPMTDPGPLALLKNGGLQHNLDASKKAMASYAGYAGIAMDMDNTFLTAETVLQAVFSNIFKRGLGYIDLNLSLIHI